MAPAPETTMVRPDQKALHVFTHSSQGGRKYMEDTFVVAFRGEASFPSPSSPPPFPSPPSPSEGQACYPIECTTTTATRVSTVSYMFAGIFDGHGGKEASHFTRDHLLQNIVSQEDFFKQEDDAILNAIRKGFLKTHNDMNSVVESWPKTSAGLKSTAGTTASVCFIMRGKVYSGHVGDSRIVLGQNNPDTGMWIAKALTVDHKPESESEKIRIKAAGGEVQNKAGVERVVWNRPRILKQSNAIFNQSKDKNGPSFTTVVTYDRIPFLAVARSLGDLWSYNDETDTYVVSPDPDLDVHELGPNDKCLVLASDGLWNMILDYESIRIVQESSQANNPKCSPIKRRVVSSIVSMGSHPEVNPSEALVEYALQKWNNNKMRADNTSAITLLFDDLTCRFHQDHNNNSSPSTNHVDTPGSETSWNMANDTIDKSFHYLINSSRTGSKLMNSSCFQQDESSTFGFNKTSSSPLLSPPMQSLCELATKTNLDTGLPSPHKRKCFLYETNLTSNTSPPNSLSFPISESPTSPCSSPSSSPPLNTEPQSALYVNQLPDEKFAALSESLKMKDHPVAPPKIVRGHEVIYDFEEPMSPCNSTPTEPEKRLKNGRPCKDAVMNVFEGMIINSIPESVTDKGNRIPATNGLVVKVKDSIPLDELEGSLMTNPPVSAGDMRVSPTDEPVLEIKSNTWVSLTKGATIPTTTLTENVMRPLTPSIDATSCRKRKKSKSKVSLTSAKRFRPLESCRLLYAKIVGSKPGTSKADPEPDE